MKPGAFLLSVFLSLTPHCFVRAQTYPSKPIRLIVPTSPGVGPDVVARVISQFLAARFGGQVVVDNRPGAGTVLGTELVVKSPADGYTLFMAPPSLATNQSIYKKLPYDALRDLKPITLLTSNTSVLVVHPSLPAKSVRELINLAKGRPGEIVFGSGGNGSFTHLSMELFLLSTTTRMLHVPYKGQAPAIVDLVGGRASVMMPGLSISASHLRTGRLRGLAVTSSKRSVLLPELPTIQEAADIGYEALAWSGLLAPAGTPNEILTRLHQEVTAIVRAREVRDRLANDGMEVLGTSPDEFADFIRSEIAKWAKVVKSAGIQPE